MQFYGLDREVGKLKTKVNYPLAFASQEFYWKNKLSGGSARQTMPAYYSYEEIRAQRWGNLDLHRYKVDVQPVPVQLSGSYQYMDRSVLYAPKPTRVLGPYSGSGLTSWNDTYLLPQGRIIPNSAIDKSGSILLSRAWPTNPTAALATFLGELKDGLPAMIGASFKKSGLKGLPGEFLNIQFGYLPVFSDAQSFIEAWNEGPKRIAQLRRDAGKPVKRTRRLPEELKTTSSTVMAYPDIPGITIYDASQSPLYTTTIQQTNTWMVGSFYYYIPDRFTSKAMNDALDSFQYNWGLIPGIDTLWELTPMSFAVDYFVNVGSLLTNLRRLSEGNFFTNGFVMVHDVEVIARAHLGGTCVSTKERKYRRRVNPFGLAAGTQLSTMQSTILGAIGASRFLK